MRQIHSESSLRVAVLSCGDLGAEVCARLLEVEEVGAVALVTAPYRVPRRGVVERLRRSVRHDGLVATAGALVRRGARALKRAVGSGTDTGSAAPGPAECPEGVDHRHFPSFRCGECLEWLRAFDPDLGVVAGTHVLPEEVYGVPRLGSINLHMGKAPEYRGAAPAFWELYRCESGVGVTIHRVTDELDGGAILARETLPLDEAPAGDPMRYLERYRREILRPNALRLLAATVREIATGEAEEWSQDPSEARTRLMPTRRDVWRLRGRVLRRRLGRRAKDLFGRMVFGSGLHRRLLRRRAAVLLFHRVDDALADDPMSCTVTEFRSYCAFFARHFEVVSLGALLEDLAADVDLTGKVAITFDDGYRDNHDVAAPVLESLGLRATFFLATAFIGSDGTPWWDRRLMRPPAWMSWEEVRSLHRRGFAIGAHTRTHADLGRVRGETAKGEIEGAGRDIAREIGVETPFFSYPYGGPDRLTEENRDRVREAGYRCCLSAHGGTIRPEADPYRLPRVPVSGWYVSPYHFGADLVLAALREPEPVRSSSPPRS